MKPIEIRKNYLRLLQAESITEKIEALKLVIDLGFVIVKNHKKKDRTGPIKQDAFILFQMSILRSISIMEMARGISYSNAIDNSKINTIDPFSALNLVRSMFEAYCNFNNIFIQSQSKAELELKYDLWVLSGLQYRQRFDATEDEHKAKKTAEAKQIDELILSIHQNSCYAKLRPGSQKNINDAIANKNWQIAIVGEKACKKGWQALWETAVPKSALGDQYSFLSLSTHPSNVSVFQFGTMYDKKLDEFSMKIALRLSETFLSCFIRDYCTFFPELIPLFNNAPPISQLLINVYNRMYRGEEYALNQLHKNI